MYQRAQSEIRLREQLRFITCIVAIAVRPNTIIVRERFRIIVIVVRPLLIIVRLLTILLTFSNHWWHLIVLSVTKTLMMCCY